MKLPENERQRKPSSEFCNIFPKRLLYLSIENENGCGSCNFENLKNITRAYISRNALAFMRFSMQIALHSVQLSLVINLIELEGTLFIRNPPSLSAKENVQKVEFVVFKIK